MGYPLQLSLRYLGSKKKGAFVSVGTAFAIVGVALGVAALATALSVTGGFKTEFRNKVLGVNAHVLVLKYTADFTEYRDVIEKVKDVPGVLGIQPFTINPMMVSHGDKTATGVSLKGVDPERVASVLDLPRHIRQGALDGLAPRPKSPAAVTSAAAPVAVASAAPTVEPGNQAASAHERPRAARSRVAGPAGANAGSEKATRKGVRPREDQEVPTGSVVPAGGYQSALPDDDLLPPDLMPDPCADPAQVARLPGVVVGTTLSRNLALKIGDCVQVTSPTIGLTFSRGKIRPAVAKQFRVVATFEAGFDQYDSKFVYTDLSHAQEFNDQGDAVTGVEMKIADIDRSQDIAKQVRAKLGGGLYHTMDWAELNHGLFTALLIQQIAMGIVLSLILVVAAFTVVATLIMVVLDKQREIAVLKAMGATDEGVLRSFLYQGGIIGVVGTSIGLGLGLLLCKGLILYAFPLDPKVYFISHLPVDAKPSHFIVSSVVAVLTCLLATTIPALYAARLRPADGLRAQ